MKVKSEPPTLSDFMTKAFGNNWQYKADWRPPRPGARIITKSEYDRVIAEWRAAWKEWETTNG